MMIRYCWALLAVFASQVHAQGPTSDPDAVVAKQIAAYNHHDVGTLFSVQDDTAGAYGFDDSPALHSKDSVSKEFADFFAKNPKVHARVLDQMDVRPFVVKRMRVTGLADGQPVQIIVVWQVKGGRVVNFWQTPFISDSEAKTAAAREERPRAVVLRATRGFERGDVAAATAAFSDPATFHPLGGTDQVTKSSRAELRGSYAKTLATMPHLKHTVVKEMALGPYVVQHERFTGKPDGKTTDAVDVLIVRDGKIASEWESPW